MIKVSDVRDFGGTWSHGTFLTEDLFRVLLSRGDLIKDDLITQDLRDPHKCDQVKGWVTDWDRLAAEVEVALRVVARSQVDDSLLIELRVELMDLIQEVLPEGYYLGSHPGDGSDLGVWEEDPE